MSTISGWGRYPRVASDLVAADGPDSVLGYLGAGHGIIARGNGRAYGDAAIGERTTLSMRRLDRWQTFDRETGRLEVEAGVLLADILAICVSAGFFPPVVPGTRQVTVGGMIAADVHGKNHHRDGGFGAHLESLTLCLADGSRTVCSRRENADLFAATIGGMGLTGMILTAAFRLSRIETGWIRQHTVAATDLAATFAALRDSATSTYSVAWIDCLARGPSLGRGLVYRGEHATRSEVDRTHPGSDAFPSSGRDGIRVPFDLPSWTLNRASVAAFNALYLRRGAARAGAPSLVPWKAFFFPLDGVNDWNRLYGSRGFVQHQCVVPPAGAPHVIAEILDRVARFGSVSPLSVLKQLGPGHGVMSFPMEGYTLALDIPATPKAFALLEDIDRLVAGAGGRLYLAKDARQSRATLEAGYPGVARFRAMRRDLDVDTRIASRLSTRLGL